MKKHQIAILLKLIPISQVLYAYIVSNHRRGEITLYPVMLREELGLKGSTIYKGLADLKDKGLITEIYKYKYKFNDLTEIADDSQRVD